MLTEMLRLYTKICIVLGIGIDVFYLPEGKYMVIHETHERVSRICKTYHYKSIVKSKEGKWIFVLSQRPLPLKFQI